MKYVIPGLLLLSTVGCATARLPKGPDTSILIRHQEPAPVVAARALDERGSEKIGAIGATTIFVRKSELVNLVSNHLIRYLNEKVGLDVERVQTIETDSIQLTATKKKAEGVILLRIKSLRMFSLDALLDPVQTDLTLELIVFDERGEAIYRRAVTGRHEKRIGISVVEKSAGELVESVVKETLRQYLRDRDLRRIIARFKYGALGGAIAQIL